MKVKDLIKKLQELPQDATIGIIDVYDYDISEYVFIYDDKDIIIDLYTDMTIKDIENRRKTNQSNICDFYIG